MTNDHGCEEESIWRTKTNAQFVAHSKAIMEALASIGLKVVFVQALVRHAYVPKGPFYMTFGSNFHDPNGGTQKIMHGGTIEIVGDWEIMARISRTNGRDEDIFIVFVHGHLSSGGTRLRDVRTHGLLLNPEIDPLVSSAMATEFAAAKMA